MATLTTVVAPARTRQSSGRTGRRTVAGLPAQHRLLPAWAACCFIAGTLLRPPLWVAVALLVLALLLVLRAVVGRARVPRALVVGQAGDAAAEALRLGPQSGHRMEAVAWCDPAGLEQAVLRHRPDVVVVLPGPALAGRVLRRITWHLELARIPLFVSSRLEDLTPSRARVLRVGSVGLMQIRPAAHARLQRALKRCWEWAAATTGLILIAPVLVVIAVAIRLDSRGPVIFRQERVGRAGNPFTMLKFRTMAIDAEARRRDVDNDCDGALFKSRRDPRVTRVGRVLRRYSLDELPQLVNVVRGQMALVGPRPALFSELGQYDDDSFRRLAVPPGMTGLWQVSGRSDLPWEEAVRLDLDYVDNWSLGLDTRILARTARAVLGHSGAY
jgi:exopolysaccharide biosynthesis polyprenyl glycosylphosphotransferase